MTRNFICAFSILIIAASTDVASPDDPDFEREIAPILAKRCLECHNPRDAKGGLNLASHEAVLKGGESGVVLVAGKPQESYFVERIETGEMPPELRGRSQKLPDAEVALLKRWIAAGAKWPKGRTLSIYERTTDVRAGLDWWSLQEVQRPAVPNVENAARVANPIDAFVLARLQKAGMQPAPLADRRTLIRRAYFDLIGLPPPPDRIDAFLKDKSPDAYEELIDELLRSKHYGERWARYWLDLVRFAETCGYERDQLKPNIWRYRDWVINALNRDMPYDRFVTDQVAGDEVPYRDEQSVIATGMLRAGTWNDEPNDAADYLYTRLEDMVHTTTSAFLGLTVKCARCHDHKFDPIRQTDYYRTASFFWAGYMGQANLGGPNKEQLGFDVFGWTDKGAKVESIRLLIKGERHRPGQVVEPGFLSSIPALDKPFAPPPEASKTTHRRLQFARWITNPRNPLTARVMVNRLWQHHFGQAIVRTPNNFGFKSDPPTHPQLLDWLAAECVNPTISVDRAANGPREDQPWTLKRMHKLIMMSNTYRQSSVHPRHDEYAEKDFLNRLWWRFNRRRL
ncbi:MAG: PSD1 domain-containing protein, partial [Planctomycetes bacterium]|nr:PSD1 domain-containing protein [Planctomycetota bacterium]